MEPEIRPRAAARGRELGAWLAVTVLGCLLVLLAAGRTWVSVAQTGADAPTGGDLSPVLTPVALDCDGDALLVRVDQVGAACHTGDRTCFDAGDLGAVVSHG